MTGFSLLYFLVYCHFSFSLALIATSLLLCLPLYLLVVLCLGRQKLHYQTCGTWIFFYPRHIAVHFCMLFSLLAGCMPPFVGFRSAMFCFTDLSNIVFMYISFLSAFVTTTPFLFSSLLTFGDSNNFSITLHFFLGDSGKLDFAFVTALYSVLLEVKGDFSGDVDVFSVFNYFQSVFSFSP